MCASTGRSGVGGGGKWSIEGPGVKTSARRCAGWRRSDHFVVIDRTRGGNQERDMAPEATPGSNTPLPADGERATLAERLERSFSPEEFRRFISHLPGGEQILSDLPLELRGSAAFFSDAAGVLLRRGAVDLRFLELWRLQRPGRSDDVEHSAALLRLHRQDRGTIRNPNELPIPSRIVTIRWLVALLGGAAVLLVARLVGSLAVARPLHALEIDRIAAPASAVAPPAPVLPHTFAPPLPERTPPVTTHVMSRPAATREKSSPVTPASVPTVEPSAPPPRLLATLGALVEGCAWDNQNGMVAVRIAREPADPVRPALQPSDGPTTRCVHQALREGWPSVAAAMRAEGLRSVSVRFTARTGPSLFDERRGE